MFLHCSRQVDMLNVFNDVIDLFGMLFSNFHKWLSSDVGYEHGVWICVYGTPVHA